MTTTPTAQLFWNLIVECPKCKDNNDLAGPAHDSEYDISMRIFNNAWDKLQGREVTCEFCGHEFKIAKVEY